MNATFPGDTNAAVDLLNSLLIDLYRSNPVGQIGPAKLGRYLTAFRSQGIDMREFYAYAKANPPFQKGK